MIVKRVLIADSYRELLSNIEDIEEKMIPVYVRELVRRHRSGYTIPVSSYRRCKELLFYKDSLERNSPYYVDILKISDRNNLKIVLSDICKTIRIKDSLYD